MEQGNFEVMNGKEAAAYLRIGYFSLMRKAKSNEVPSFRVGGRVLFRRCTLDAWITNQETCRFEINQGQIGSLRKVQE